MKLVRAELILLKPEEKLVKVIREIGQNENNKKKKVERTSEEWREYYREKSKKYYDKNKEK